VDVVSAVVAQRILEKMADKDTEIQLLRKDLESLSSLTTKLDIAIEKLSDVADGMNRILAVHELRLENHEKQLNQWTHQYETLHERINSSRKEYSVELEKSHSILLDHLESLQAAQGSHHKEISNRVDRLERWKYLVIGGAVAIGYIISKASFFGKLLG
jgi:chromosome segregation ATPase